MAHGALQFIVTVIPSFRESMSPPLLVLVSSLKEVVGVAVGGFCKLLIASVKSRAG